MTDNPIMTRDEAAEFLRVKPSWLRNIASQGPVELAPPYRKIGGQVFYLRDELLNWLQNHPIQQIASRKVVPRQRRGRPSKLESVLRRTRSSAE